MDELVKRYKKMVDNYGMFNHGEEYNIHSVHGQHGYTSHQNTVPMTVNPSGMLYSYGPDNRVLFSASSKNCDEGCVLVHPDPRSNVVKPLYQGWVHQPSSYAKPHSAYTNGMY